MNASSKFSVRMISAKAVYAIDRFTKAALAAVVLISVTACASLSSEPAKPEWRLMIHGGAGVILPSDLTPEKEAAYRAGLGAALDAGAAVLSTGGNALDAVEAAVLMMEDNPLFNAGKGAVFTADGGHELDAAIMDGRTRAAGAVAGTTRVRNPIRAARAVMENSEHVMFAGAGADEFARAQGLEMVENNWFDTDARRLSLERVLQERRRTSAEKAGTVGAVAVDVDGNLAAATTTGGMTAKTKGRVGDAPLIGAGTYAQNDVCAVSATGHGEYFIRVGVAKTICERMRYKRESGLKAATVALGEVATLGGDGGVIVMDGRGRADYVFNSPGMYRGQIDATTRETAIFGAGAPDVQSKTRNH